MKMTVTLGGRNYAVDTARPLDISIPYRFSGPRLTVYGAPPAAAEYYIKSVAEGGSVNCEEYKIIPHCHGTHTEGRGHIAKERVSVLSVLKDGLIPATLVTVKPEGNVIAKSMLEGNILPDFSGALVIRTLPNGPDKAARNYDVKAPPCIAGEAMAYIASLGVRHLLVDIPSVDPLQDGGKLAAHRALWDENPGATITEMIYAPDDIPDGPYILNLQVAPFDADATPSRPLLYRVEAA